MQHEGTVATGAFSSFDDSVCSIQFSGVPDHYVLLVDNGNVGAYLLHRVKGDTYRLIQKLFYSPSPGGHTRFKSLAYVGADALDEKRSSWMMHYLYTDEYRFAFDGEDLLDNKDVDPELKRYCLAEEVCTEASVESYRVSFLCHMNTKGAADAAFELSCDLAFVSRYQERKQDVFDRWHQEKGASLKYQKGAGVLKLHLEQGRWEQLEFAVSDTEQVLEVPLKATRQFQLKSQFCQGAMGLNADGAELSEADVAAFNAHLCARL